MPPFHGPNNVDNFTQVFRARLMGDAARSATSALRSYSSVAGKPGTVTPTEALLGPSVLHVAGTATTTEALLGTSSVLHVAVKVVPFMVSAESYDAKSLQALRHEVKVSEGNLPYGHEVKVSEGNLVCFSPYSLAPLLSQPLPCITMDD